MREFQQLELFDAKPLTLELIPEIFDFIDALSNVGVKDSEDEFDWPYVHLLLSETAGFGLGRTIITETLDIQDSFKEVRGFISELAVKSYFGWPESHFVTLWRDITDDGFNVEVDLRCVERIDLFDANYTAIMAAYQNAQADGSTIWYQRSQGLPTVHTLVPEELEYFVMHPPKPVSQTRSMFLHQRS